MKTHDTNHRWKSSQYNEYSEILSILVVLLSLFSLLTNAAEVLDQRSKELGSNGLSNAKKSATEDEKVGTHMVAEYQRLEGKLPIDTPNQTLQALRVALAHDYRSSMSTKFCAMQK